MVLAALVIYTTQLYPLQSCHIYYTVIYTLWWFAFWCWSTVVWRLYNLKWFGFDIFCGGSQFTLQSVIQDFVEILRKKRMFQDLEWTLWTRRWSKFFSCHRSGWSKGISWPSWDWRIFPKGAELRSLVLPELCTRQHMWSAREKSFDILRHGWELNPDQREDRQWAIPLSYHRPDHREDRQWAISLRYHDPGHREDKQ